MNHAIKKTQSILDKVVIGYRPIEPCIWAALALRSGVYLQARHGVGKTVLGKTLGMACDPSGRGFRFYSCDKAGMVDMAGLPDLDKSSKSGKLSFVPHDKSLFGAKIIVADELPRANKDRMNGWLEVLEERTYLGLPLDYDLAIATGNDSTYIGNNKLDLALKSRFMFFLPCDDFKTVSADDVERMIDLNLDKRDIKEIAQQGSELINEIRARIEKFRQDENLLKQLKAFIASFIQFVKDKINQDKDLSQDHEAYISPREFAYQMIHAMLGLGAYFDYFGERNPFQVAGEYTVKYTIETRHAAAGDKLLNICRLAWRQLRNMLLDGINTPEGQLKWKFASSISAAQKVAFWREYISDSCQLLNDNDLTTMAGDTLQQVETENIGQVGPFWHVMGQNSRTKHIAAEIEGFVMTEIARKMFTGIHEDAPKNIKLVAAKYQNADHITPDGVAEILGAA